MLLDFNSIKSDFGLSLFGVNVVLSISIASLDKVIEHSAVVCHLLVIAVVLVLIDGDQDLRVVVSVGKGVRIREDLVPFELVIHLLLILTLVDRLVGSWHLSLLAQREEQPVACTHLQVGREEELACGLPVVRLLLFA